MALWLLKKYNRLNQSLATLYSDSQAFIKSISAQQLSLGYHLVKKFTSLAEKLT
jgi:hypothetical protein